MKDCSQNNRMKRNRLISALFNIQKKLVYVYLIWFYYIFTFDNNFILFRFNDEENTYLTNYLSYIGIYRYIYMNIMDGSEVSLNDLCHFFLLLFHMC